MGGMAMGMGGGPPPFRPPFGGPGALGSNFFEIRKDVFNKGVQGQQVCCRVVLHGGGAHVTELGTCASCQHCSCSEGQQHCFPDVGAPGQHVCCVSVHARPVLGLGFWVYFARAPVHEKVHLLLFPKLTAAAVTAAV
eukprot:207191-Pelagomonas_calceolata.AAC.1